MTFCHHDRESSRNGGKRALSDITKLRRNNENVKYFIKKFSYDIMTYGKVQ